MVTLLPGVRNVHAIQEAIHKEPGKVFNLASDAIKLGPVESNREAQRPC